MHETNFLLSVVCRDVLFGVLVFLRLKMVKTIWVSLRKFVKEDVPEGRVVHGNGLVMVLDENIANTRGPKGG